MSEPKNDAGLEDRRFKEMSVQEKLVFAVKAVLFLVSGGFVFPTLWVD